MWGGRVAFGPDSRTLVAVVGYFAHIWDLATGRGKLLAFGPGGARLAGVGTDRTVRVWDTATGEMVASWPANLPGPAGVAVSADGRHLALADPTAVKVFEFPGGREVRNWPASGAVAFGPGGRLAADDGAGLGVWDVESGARVCTLAEKARTVVFSPDGAHLVAGGMDGVVRWWDANAGRPGRTVVASDRPIRSLAFTPDGRRLAVAAQDLRVRVWDTGTGDEVLDLPSLNAYALGFSGDGATLMGLTYGGPVYWHAGPDPRPDGPAAPALVAQWHDEQSRRGPPGSCDWWHLTRVVALNPAAEPGLRQRFGEAAARAAAGYGTLGDWAAAREMAAQFVALGFTPLDLDRVGWEVAWLRIVFGDEAESKKRAAGLVSRYQTAKATAATVQLAARLAALVPGRLDDPKAATTLALRATGLDAKSADAWQTLALARLRAGDAGGAVEALDRAAALRPGDDPERDLIRALAEKGRGNADDAAKCLARAVKAMDAAAPQVGGGFAREELRRLRAEAEGP